MKNIIYLTFVSLFIISCSAQKTNLRFEKIIFHTSACFGTCPEYHLELNNKKEIKLYIEKAYQKRNIDTLKIGYYKGKLDNDTYTEFINLLDKIDLEKSGIMEFEPKTIELNEGSKMSLILYMDKQRKPIKYIYPEGHMQKLMTFLYKITDHESLIRINEKLEVEPFK